MEQRQGYVESMVIRLRSLEDCNDSPVFAQVRLLISMIDLTSSHGLDMSELENPDGLTSSHGLDMANLENPDGLRFIKLGGKQHWRGVIQ